MSSHLAQARRPRGDAAAATVKDDPEVLASFLEDAAHFPGGHAVGIATPASEADVVTLLRASRRVLPIGAQSSLTGGATPMGDVLVATSHLNRILGIGDDWVRVEAGVSLEELDRALRRAGKLYPPAPTFMGAFVGGTLATNAAGAATFKYGTTRDWVRALTIVLPSGDVLDVERGVTCAHPDGFFEIELPSLPRRSERSSRRRVPVPSYRMPAVAKVSAGYFAAPRMDLIDLFIGSEGTLGVITAATLRLLPVRPAVCLVFVPFTTRAAAMTFVTTLRQQAQETWRRQEAAGLDIAAIEHMDARCLALLREDAVDRQYGVSIPDDAAIALLVTIELPPGTTSAEAFDDIGRAREAGARDTALGRFCRLLDAAGVFDRVEIAVPGDEARAAQLLAVREAVPAAVNARVGRAKQMDSRITKTAADMIVPFERLGELLDLYDEEFTRRGLDAAVWGHISDGNLHPNVIPGSFADVESGRAAIRRFGRETIRMGGSPLAEHGVGRNPTKQHVLEDLYGAGGVDQMRAVKRALDPDWKLAPGVIFGSPS